MLQAEVDRVGAGGIVAGLLESDGTTRFVSVGDPGPGARPLAPESLFEIGSATKVFAGIVLADFVAEGRVSYTDEVSRYLPAGVVVPDDGARRVTLLDLATHQSGIVRDFGDRTDPGPPTIDDLYALLAAHGPLPGIGGEYSYSNVGMGLLGHALSQAGGRPLDDLVLDRVLTPLGMDLSGYDLTPDRQVWMTRGHNREGVSIPKRPASVDVEYASFGAVGIESNVRDLLVFLAANVGEATTPLQEVLRDVQRPRRRRGNPAGGAWIGVTWFIRMIGTTEVVFHNGVTGGFRSFMGFDPSTRVGVVLLANAHAQLPRLGFHLIEPRLPLNPDR